MLLIAMNMKAWSADLNIPPANINLIKVEMLFNHAALCDNSNTQNHKFTQLAVSQDSPCQVSQVRGQSDVNVPHIRMWCCNDKLASPHTYIRIGQSGPWLYVSETLCFPFRIPCQRWQASTITISCTCCSTFTSWLSSF